MRRFYGCYLLVSLGTENKWYKGRTYIGFTVNPQRRLRQHNGEVKGGAKKTSKGRTWEMVMVVYGFPTKVAALQFEWAWQNPQKSNLVKDAVGVLAKKEQIGVAGKVRIVFEMLHCDPWKYFPLITHFFSTERSKLKDGCRQPPGHIPDIIAPMDELPQCIHETSDMEEEAIDEGELASTIGASRMQENDAITNRMDGDAAQPSIPNNRGVEVQQGEDPDAERKERRKCVICKKIAKPSWVSCECGGRYHIRCLAEHLFLHGEDFAATEQEGKCTACSRNLVWMDVLSTFASNSTWNAYRSAIETARMEACAEILRKAQNPPKKTKKPRQPKNKKPRGQRGESETTSRVDAPMGIHGEDLLVEERDFFDFDRPIVDGLGAGPSDAFLPEPGGSALGIDLDCDGNLGGRAPCGDENGLQPDDFNAQPIKKKKRELIRLWHRPGTPDEAPDIGIPPTNVNEAVDLLTPSPLGFGKSFPRPPEITNMGSPIDGGNNLISAANDWINASQQSPGVDPLNSAISNRSGGVVGPSSSQVIALTPLRNPGGDAQSNSQVELLYSTPCLDRSRENRETVDLVTPPQLLCSFQRMSVKRNGQENVDSGKKEAVLTQSPPHSPISFRQRILEQKRAVQN
ncbi:hypothetical protein BSKO_09515 [Bryopsis sp. KO-2023]|nr:hypothetical protein BSKO_09515 [Bryopsis sp. KO-2023]